MSCSPLIWGPKCKTLKIYFFDRKLSIYGWGESARFMKLRAQWEEKERSSLLISLINFIDFPETEILWKPKKHSWYAFWSTLKAIIGNTRIFFPWHLLSLPTSDQLFSVTKGETVLFIHWNSLLSSREMLSFYLGIREEVHNELSKLSVPRILTRAVQA